MPKNVSWGTKANSKVAKSWILLFQEFIWKLHSGNILHFHSITGFRGLCLISGVQLCSSIATASITLLEFWARCFLECLTSSGDIAVQVTAANECRLAHWIFLSDMKLVCIIVLAFWFHFLKRVKKLKLTVTANNLFAKPFPFHT